MKITLYFLLLSILLLFSCAHATVVSNNNGLIDKGFKQYHCDFNKGFQVAFAGSESAILKLDKKKYQLKQVLAASGCRYILDDASKALKNFVMLHTKGDEAMLKIGERLYRNCKIEK